MIARRRRILLAAAIFLILAAPATSLADDLSVLVYVVYVWPAAILSGLILAILSIVALVRLRREPQQKNRRFGTGILVAAVVLDAAFTGLTLAAEGSRNFKSGGFAVANILVFQVVVVIAVSIAARIRRHTQAR